MPKCRICDADMDIFTDEPCEACNAVINDTIQEDAEEDLKKLNEEDKIWDQVNKEASWLPGDDDES